MVTRKRLLNLKEMEVIASDATRSALSAYEMSTELRRNLVLGERITDSEGIFELYFPGERPEDARFVTRAIVDRTTGEVGVEVFPWWPAKDADSPLV